MGMTANLHCGSDCRVGVDRTVTKMCVTVYSRPAPGVASDEMAIFARPDQLTDIALSILADKTVRANLADDQWRELSQLVRGHDVAEMADAHVAECPECQAWYDQRDAAMAEDDEYERRLTRCNKAAVIGLDGPIGCRLASEHAGPCVPQHGLTTGTAS